tara:strand:+ start:44211 stop:45365 length:1155 start_codon:yes stop_codon:yes gene_type:complete
MNSDPQQELEKLLSTLEPWQRQWVACRAAMRVLPAIGAVGDFRFWDDPKTSVAAVARLPWLVSFSHLMTVDISVDQAAAKHAASFSRSFNQRTFSTIADYASAVTSAASATYVASISGDEGLTSIVTCIRSINESVGAAARAVVTAVAHTAFAANVKAIALADADWFSSVTTDGKAECNGDLWRNFFGRGLWEPIDPWPYGWQSAIARFREDLAKVKMSHLADQYEEHCREGADFEKIQRWLFGEVRIPLHSEDCIELPESDAWWMQLLYRIGLEDRGRLNVLVQPRMNDVVTALADCVRSLTAEPDEARSKSTKRAAKVHRSKAATREATTRLPRRQEVVDVASWLEKQYGHLSPPPLWTAWFQAVHGDELRKIRRHFVKEAR